jgi:hypothetical protein
MRIPPLQLNPGPLYTPQQNICLSRSSQRLLNFCLPVPVLYQICRVIRTADYIAQLVKPSFVSKATKRQNKPI